MKYLLISSALLFSSIQAQAISDEFISVCSGLGITEQNLSIRYSNDPEFVYAFTGEINEHLGLPPDFYLSKAKREAEGIVENDRTHDFKVKKAFFSGKYSITMREGDEWKSREYDQKVVCKEQFTKQWAYRALDAINTRAKINAQAKEAATKELDEIRKRRGTDKRTLADLDIGKLRKIPLFDSRVLKLCQSEGFYLGNKDLMNLTINPYTFVDVKVDADLYHAYKKKEYVKNMSVLHDICYEYADSKSFNKNDLNYSANDVLSVSEARAAVKIVEDKKQQAQRARDELERKAKLNSEREALLAKKLKEAQIHEANLKAQAIKEKMDARNAEIKDLQIQQSELRSEMDRINDLYKSHAPKKSFVMISYRLDDGTMVGSMKGSIVGIQDFHGIIDKAGSYRLELVKLENTLSRRLDNGFMETIPVFGVSTKGQQDYEEWKKTSEAASLAKQYENAETSLNELSNKIDLLRK